MQEADGAATRSALGKGRRLFNSGRFFEAHEVWEEAWLREEGETRRLLQGLIQIAAGYHHAFHTRQARGCVRLLETGLDRLHALADGGDLALDAFRQAVTLSLERARSWERGQSVGLSRAEAPRLGLSKE